MQEKQQMSSKLNYFKMQLDVITEKVNNLKGLLPDEKKGVKQQLSTPMLYCVDRKFSVRREGRHRKWY